MSCTSTSDTELNTSYKNENEEMELQSNGCAHNEVNNVWMKGNDDQNDDTSTSSNPSSIQHIPEEEEEEEEEDARVYPISPSSSQINAVLSTRDLWQQFDELDTEMIVTRRGRRMFPPIKVELHDLKPSSFYILLMDLVPVDKYRYKYQNSQWVKCFEESCSPTRLYVHPESPALGSYWMEHNISFYKLKLTNNQLDKQGHIIVNSMHRYQPRLHIVESSDMHNLNWKDFNTFEFPKTQFITVTAYQNDKITQLKIENNPFAKGFRQPMSRIRMKPIKNVITSTPINMGSENSSVLLQRNGVIHSKRQRSNSEDELPLNKKPLFHNDMQTFGGKLLSSSLKRYNSSPNNDTHIRELPPHSTTVLCNSSPPELIPSNSFNNHVQLVQLSPSLSCTDVSLPNVYLTSPVNSSSEESEESDMDSPSANSRGKLVFSDEAIKSTVNLNDRIMKVNDRYKQHSLTAAASKASPLQTVPNSFFPTTTPQIIPTSAPALQQVIPYPQPIFLHPNPDGRTQQILVPIATVPITAAPSSINKMPNGGPQGLYLQTCPIVQGANSSQTLPLATLPNGERTTSPGVQSKQQVSTAQLLSRSLPICINGHSTHLPMQSSQPIQIVTLANAPPRVVHS